MLKLMVEIGLGTAALGAEEAAKVHHLELNTASECIANYVQLFASFNSICLLGLASEDFDTLVSGLSSAQDNEVVSQFIAFLFRRASHTGKDIGVEALGSILQSSHLAAPTAVAIAAYITSSDADDLEGVEYAPASHDFNHAPIECAFIRTLPAFRSAALKAYIHQVERNELAAVPDGFFAALVEAYSTHNSDLNKYVWNDSADADVQGHLSNILRTILPHLLEEPLDQSQVELFVRAASLIDVFDKEEMLAHIAKDRKKANLSDRLVALLEVLIQDEDEIEATGMKSWFLMAFDHLTRRFAEDAVLSAKVLGFAKALGKFGLLRNDGDQRSVW